MTPLRQHRHSILVALAAPHQDLAVSRPDESEADLAVSHLPGMAFLVKKDVVFDQRR